MKPSRLPIGVLFWLALSVASQGSPSEELVERLQETYSSLQSFSADFEQIFTSPLAELRESGIVLMKKPGKMFWEYNDPTRKIFVTDGRSSYFYLPGDRQVIVGELDLESEQTPLLFLVGRGDIRRDFTVETEVEEQALDAGNPLVKLVPKDPNPQFSYLIIEVSIPRYLVRRLIVVEPIGNRNEYILSNMEENVPIPEERFRFQVPPGVEVITQ